MRLYSRIYKYHLQVRLFALTALVYAKSLKKIKNFKTSSKSCVKPTLMKSHGSVNNGGGNRSDGGQGSNNGANQNIHKKPRRQ